MSNHMWQKLEQRLQDIVANNYRKVNKHLDGRCSILLCINIIQSNDNLIGWYKPQLIPLEPRGIDPLLIAELQHVEDWNQVISDLKINGDRILVVQNTKPVGWLP